MTAETLGVRADIACVTYTWHMHMYRYDRAEEVLTLFRSISLPSYAVESQIRKAE
jgi:hypothetical protein